MKLNDNQNIVLNELWNMLMDQKEEIDKDKICSVFSVIDDFVIDYDDRSSANHISKAFMSLTAIEEAQVLKSFMEDILKYES